MLAETSDFFPIKCLKKNQTKGAGRFEVWSENLLSSKYLPTTSTLGLHEGYLAGQAWLITAPCGPEFAFLGSPPAKKNNLI